MPFLIGHAITEMHGTVDAKDFVFLHLHYNIHKLSNKCVCHVKLQTWESLDS